ncbi:ATP-grasp domain-containing protein [Micromonospora sp. WMMD1082]|uniref:ATP-grasp domain-containing protein n=1 Tax=Micromonospora sp. WMMD1082 TaxID=3016104 RepID=UPI0024161B45|nr:ATP-grasp domain-containing protein [Micromonospora sp. WMMD1082]MDG4795548.1 ATP-grasp domain-containing protein [Micromonospora sp. WMMD1082]
MSDRRTISVHDRPTTAGHDRPAAAVTDRPTVAVVDGFGSASRLAQGFRDAGHDCVRVQSTVDIPEHYRRELDLSRYTANIVHHGNVSATVGLLAAYRPLAVIAGAEQGVELADALAEAAGLPGNGTTLSYARRTKDAQIAAIAAAGLPAARQLPVRDAEQLTAWHRKVGGRVVVKPIRSARNDGVHICDTPTESVAAYRQIRSAVNDFGHRNEGVVAQEYLTGTEFVVNTVSWRGRHRVTDTWRYHKIDVNGVRDRINGIRSVPPTDPRWTSLRRYASAVLDALGIRYGPAHLEVILTVTGPRLVEVGARLCGSDVARYAVHATGESQIDRTVQAYLDGERFLAEIDAPYRCDGHAAMAFLVSPVEGRLKGYPLLDQVERLASYQGRSVRVHPGELLRRTIDDSSEPLAVGLAHTDAATLEKDFQTICYLDGPGFYKLEEAHHG